MEREGQLRTVDIGNTMPIVSAEDSRIIFDKAAPNLALKVVEIASRRLSSGIPEQEDAGIDIVSKFKKQFFSEKPSVSVALQGKMGVISEEAQRRINTQLGRGGEVVVEATVISRGNS